MTLVLGLQGSLPGMWGLCKSQLGMVQDRIFNWAVTWPADLISIVAQRKERCQKWLLQYVRTTMHSPWLPFLSSLHCSVWLRYQERVLFSLLEEDLLLRLSNHWPLKMINSIFSKVETYAWFGEPFQTIRFRRGQQVRVPWRFERPATDTPHCVLIGVVDSYLGGRQNHYVKGFSFDHKIQQVLWENLITAWYIYYFKSLRWKRNAFRLDILSYTVYTPRSIPLLPKVHIEWSAFLPLLN